MKTKKQPSELKASYQAMVDSVEEFVVKEGKTLHQAFSAAEKKLEDAKEISKEKIQQVSKELKDNLHYWSETIEGVSEAYKEHMKFDLAYVNNSILDKFQSIANTNTAELITFTRTIKAQAQTVIKEEHLAAHQAHNQWDSEHALWIGEVEFWKKNNEQALTKLMEIKEALKQQSLSFFEHVQVIQAFANIDQKHEKVMKNAEQDSSSEVFKIADEKEILVHKKEQKIHAQHSEFHSALKSHHFKVMSMINMLYKEMHKAQ
jgi:thioredoxin-like negative regulator of GroEL